MTPVNLKAIYEFSFGGLTCGRMGIEIEQNGSSYNAAADITTAGIVKLFVRHLSHTTIDANGTNRDYETHYQTKKKKKYVHLVYKNGALAEETLVPSENHQTRPEVPKELRDRAADPLTFLLLMRQKLGEAMKSGKSGYSINVYDGRRLTEADFIIKGKSRINFQGRNTNVIMVNLRRKLLAGFTPSELEDYDPHEPTLHVYFTDDERLLPIMVETNYLFGRLAATLIKECRTGESCLLGIKE